VAVNCLQQLLQILTDIDSFCTRLTRNVNLTSGYESYWHKFTATIL